MWWFLVQSGPLHLGSLAADLVQQEQVPLQSFVSPQLLALSQLRSLRTQCSLALESLRLRPLSVALKPLALVLWRAGQILAWAPLLLEVVQSLLRWMAAQ